MRAVVAGVAAQVLEARLLLDVVVEKGCAQRDVVVEDCLALEELHAHQQRAGVAAAHVHGWELVAEGLQGVARVAEEDLEVRVDLAVQVHHVQHEELAQNAVVGVQVQNEAVLPCQFYFDAVHELFPDLLIMSKIYRGEGRKRERYIEK